jgi:hypothetical protein
LVRRRQLRGNRVSNGQDAGSAPFYPETAILRRVVDFTDEADI